MSEEFSMFPFHVTADDLYSAVSSVGIELEPEKWSSDSLGQLADTRSMGERCLSTALLENGHCAKSK